jgi:hypothetical protein
VPTATDRHLRFTLPDVVAATADREHAAGAWLSHRDARTSVMMQVPDVGAFVRSSLEVRLSDHSTVTFGVWLSVHPAALQIAHEVWDQPAYLALTIDGVLANAVPPWGMLAAPVHAVVRDRRHTPYCESSSDPLLTRVLTHEWPTHTIVTALDAI